MLEVMEYLKARYLSEKGQGMVEYALILAFVAVIAAGLTGNSGIASSISSTFASITGLFSTSN